MPIQKSNKTKWLHLRLSPEEYGQLQLQFSKTTCRKMSNYARKMVLGKPVVKAYRNRSLDDFMTEMMALRKELNNQGNQLNQAIKKLDNLHQTGEVKSWILTYEEAHQKFADQVEIIKNAINKMADQWLQ